MERQISCTAFVVMVLIAVGIVVNCAPDPSSGDIQRDRQEGLLSEGRAQVGMPAIKNFRELKLLKDIYELRDQTGLVTYTYLFSEVTGKLIFFCDSIGYGVPYAAQFSAPTSMQRYFVASSGAGDERHYGAAELPQAEPNGVYSPEAAEGTWVMCKNPGGDDVRPTYVEPRVVVSQFKLALGE